MAELSDAELWRCVETTVRDVLLTALADDADWARAAAVQLVGLARYASGRPQPSDNRQNELAAILDSHADNELIARHWRGNDASATVMDVVGRVLSDAVGLTNSDADEVRRTLRQTVVRQLDDELAITGDLVNAFRGQLDA